MKLYIPIRGPEFEELESDFDRFLDEFGSFENNDILTSLLDSEKEYRDFETISFSILNSSEYSKIEHPELTSIKHYFHYPSTSYVEDFLRVDVSHHATRDSDDFALMIANHIVSKLSLILSLSYKTKIDFLSGVILNDAGEYMGNTKVLISGLDFVHRQALKLKWPTIPPLNLQSTLNWFSTFNLHTDGKSQNKLHRAINAWSYQFSHIGEKDTSILFWTMLGIEALLAEGSNHIIGQIKTKSSIILGQPMEYKRKLDELYNYRSRFVHGDIDFPAKFSSDWEHFEDNYHENLVFSASILLALICVLIKSNKTEFKFEYRMTE